MISIPSRILSMIIVLSGLVGFQNSPIPFASAASPEADTASVSLVMGGGVNCYLSNGSLKCWGYNHQGAVGDNTYWDRPTPVQVSGLSSGVTAASAGVGFVCAIVSGTVKCWGDNRAGQLGNDLAAYQGLPADVAGLGGSSTLIAAGFDHVCALAGGSVKCWGLNANGQLGAGSSDNHSHVPLAVINLPAGIQTLAGGGAHTCALTAAGGVKCWGYNYFGQLGNSSNADSGQPVDVTGLASGVTALAAGYEHTCALVSGGVQCWGLNYTNKPAAVPGLTSGVTALVSGSSHLCAIRNGAMVCWGDNQAGQLGNGTLIDSAAPVAVTGLAGTVTAIGAGGGTCAVAGGQLYCWGGDDNGQLGRGTMTRTSVPWVLNDLASQTITSIKSGSLHTCALTSAGRVLCWGMNMHGELGDGKGEVVPFFSSLPVQVSGITSGASVIGGGETYSCAVVNGGAWCWGSNYYGELGDNTQQRRLTPVAVSGLSQGVTALSSAPDVDGVFHTCAVVNTGAKCWGSNANGELGNAGNTDSLVPVPVSGLSSGVTDITVGSYHTCAVVSGGVKCWGSGYYGELGNSQSGTSAKTNIPVNVNSLGSGVTALAAGDFSNCAIVNGGVQCWGLNNHSQLGNVSAGGTSSVPVQVYGLTSGVTAISAAGAHVCAVKDGNVWCWGQNRVSQLNNGQFQDSVYPVQISGLSGVTAISAGGSHDCALAGGQVLCWGEDYYGQLGVGRMYQSPVPVKVLGLADTPDLVLNTLLGASGSVLSGVVAGFPSNVLVTLSANGHTLGSFTTNFRGFSAFTLTTLNASTGIYALTASTAGQQASVNFRIAGSAIQRQQGGGYSFAVPAGITNVPIKVYMPLLLK